MATWIYKENDGGMVKQLIDPMRLNSYLQNGWHVTEEAAIADMTTEAPEEGEDTPKRRGRPKKED